MFTPARSLPDGVRWITPLVFSSPLLAMVRFPKNNTSSTLRTLQSKANQFFEGLFSGGQRNGEDSDSTLIVLRTDVLETQEGYRIRAELPGVDQEGVKIHVEKKRITIQGQCWRPAREGSQDQLDAEPLQGRFYRSVALPVRIYPLKAKAVLKSGILIIDLPKVEPERGGMPTRE